MAELGERQIAPQAEGHCFIVVEGEGGSSHTAATSSRTEMEGAQVHIKEEAASPPYTQALQQDVNTEAYYYSHLQYNTIPVTRGYPTAVEAFVRGLTPTALRQPVLIAAPTSLELAVTRAKRVEAVLASQQGCPPGLNARQPAGPPHAATVASQQGHPQATTLASQHGHTQTATLASQYGHTQAAMLTSQHSHTQAATAASLYSHTPAVPAWPRGTQPSPRQPRHPVQRCQPLPDYCERIPPHHTLPPGVTQCTQQSPHHRRSRPKTQPSAQCTQSGSGAARGFTQNSGASFGN
ncbi:UNVERIFIED_CONTAM: hypothetical protein FKN15_020891 [Acipenser sinensis]